MAGLQVLYASHNHLAVLPDVFGSLLRLQLLHVGHNHLEALPLSLLHLIQLRALSAGHNKIRQLPQGFLAAGESLPKPCLVAIMHHHVGVGNKTYRP